MYSIVKVIASACVLYNVCLTTEDDWEEMMDDEPFPDDEDSLSSSTSTTTLSSSAANLKRAYIADLLENCGGPNPHMENGEENAGVVEREENGEKKREDKE